MSVVYSSAATRSAMIVAMQEAMENSSMDQRIARDILLEKTRVSHRLHSTVAAVPGGFPGAAWTKCQTAECDSADEIERSALSIVILRASPTCG